MIESALCRVPQPRVEIALESVSDLLADVNTDTLMCRVVWAGELSTTWFAKNGTESKSASEPYGRWVDARRCARLFLPAHGLTVPDLKLELYGAFWQSHGTVQAKVGCLGVCHIRGADLVASSGRMALDLVESYKSQLDVDRSNLRNRVTRLVPGHVLIHVNAVDIPLHICNHKPALDMRESMLQVSVLDLDIVDHQNNLVRHSRPVVESYAYKLP